VRTFNSNRPTRSRATPAPPPKDAALDMVKVIQLRLAAAKSFDDEKTLFMMGMELLQRRARKQGEAT
jgi:hypothetical protein